MTQLLDKPAKDSKERVAALLREGQRGDAIQMEKIAVRGYEQVLKITDRKAGLNAFIAIHDSSLGPALGGTRIYPYKSDNEALEDVLRLSKGMTYKTAVGEVGLGGGKSVIIADPKKDKTPELLLAFGAAVDKLGGAYICAEDAGFSPADGVIVRRATKYIVGIPNAKSSGDPCPFTAWGVFRGIQSVAKKIYGTDSVEGRVIAIQGVGNVGALIADLLFWAGAELILADVDAPRVQAVAAKYRAKVVPPDQILRVECDILVPCAMGAILNDQTLPQLRCRAVAGAANNQLHRDSHGVALRDRGILYAPDFVINSGGVLNVAAELEENGYHPAYPRYKVHHLYDTLLAIYEIAEKNNESTQAAAIALAEYRLKYGIGKRNLPVTFHHTPD